MGEKTPGDDLAYQYRPRALWTGDGAVGNRTMSVWEEPAARRANGTGQRQRLRPRPLYDGPPLVVARRRRPGPLTGYGHQRHEWVAALGEGPRPGQASVTGRQRLAWLAAGLLLLALVLVLLAG